MFKREINQSSESCDIRPNLDCNYTFSINLKRGVVTLFFHNLLFQQPTEFPLLPNQSKKCNCNPNLV